MNGELEIRNPWPRPDLQAQQPVPITSRQGRPKSKSANNVLNPKQHWSHATG